MNYVSLIYIPEQKVFSFFLYKYEYIPTIWIIDIRITVFGRFIK